MRGRSGLSFLFSRNCRTRLAAFVFRQKPGGYGISEVIEPLQDRTGLIQHGVNFIHPKGNGPWKGGQGIAGNVECQQAKKRHGRITLKVTAELPGGKPGTELSTPDDPVEFFPGIAMVTAVKIDDEQSVTV